MATEKATIEAEITGLENSLKNLKNLVNGIGDVGDKADKSGKKSKGLGDSLKEFGKAHPVISGIAGAIADIGMEGARAAGIVSKIDLGGAVEGARRLDSAVASFGMQAGKSSAQLKENFDGLEQRTLKSSEATAVLAHSLSEMTGDGAYATSAIGDIEEAALALGRDAGAMLPLAATLQAMGVEGSKTKDEMNRMAAIAERVGTIGGPRAFLDVMSALRGQLAGVAMNSEQARAKMESFIAVLGKGKNREQQTQLASGAINFVKSNSLMLERATGMRVYDKDGKMNDPSKILEKYRAQFERIYGKGTVKYDRALRNKFGDDLGMAIGKMDFTEAKNETRIALGKTDGRALPGVEPLTGLMTDEEKKGLIDNQAAKARSDVANKREAAELGDKQDLRVAGEGMLKAKDKMRDVYGNRAANVLSSAAGYLPDVAQPIAAGLLVGGAYGLSDIGNGVAETKDELDRGYKHKVTQSEINLAKANGATAEQMDKLIKLYEQQLQTQKSKQLSTNKSGNEY